MLSFAEVNAGSITNTTTVALLTVTATVVAAWVWSQQKPSKNFPPGPKGWPLIGNLLEFAGKPISLLFREHTKKYGNIFSIRIGQRWTVVLNGAEVIKEALVTKKDAFANRPTTFTMNCISGGGNDIVFGQYTDPGWKVHRRLALTAFKKLTTDNKERFENLIYSVITKLDEHLIAKGSDEFNPHPTIAACVFNILTTVCFGKAYALDSEYIKTWIDLQRSATDVARNGVLADFMPIFKYIPTPTQRKLREVFDQYHGLIGAEMEKHRKAYDPESEPMDLADMVIRAQQELEAEGEEDMSLITDTRLSQTVTDIFGGGTDTSIFTMMWSIGLLVQHPEIQARVAQEVDDVVGRDRLPSIDDRKMLPYTVATIYEVIRYSTSPMTIPHATSEDVNLGGFSIPEGTWVFVNIKSMHFDESLWDNPQQFKPEHFLDENGDVCHHPNGFFAFSAGRRACLGESMGKIQLFLLLSWLFQHYQFSKAPGRENVDYSVGTEVAVGYTLEDISVVVKKRF